MCRFSDTTGIYPDDEQWRRATRGVRAGGCGLRSAQRHWPAAFLASALSTRAACCGLDRGSTTAGWDMRGLLPLPAFQLVAEYSGHAADVELATALDAYNASCTTFVEPLGLAECAVRPQRWLSQRLDVDALEADLTACRGRHADRAQLLSEAPPRAGDFLNTIPSVALGLAMRPDEFVIELKRRMRVDIVPSGCFCPYCSAAMDVKGDHALLCDWRRPHTLASCPP